MNLPFRTERVIATNPAVLGSLLGGGQGVEGGVAEVPGFSLNRVRLCYFCLLAAPDHFSLLPLIFPPDLLVPNDF